MFIIRKLKSVCEIKVLFNTDMLNEIFLRSVFENDKIQSIDQVRMQLQGFAACRKTEDGLLCLQKVNAPRAKLDIEFHCSLLILS